MAPDGRVDKSHILSEIRRTAGENDGAPLGIARFATATGIRNSDWRGRYWARWGDALIEAGFQPNQLQSRYEDDAVLSHLIPEIRRLGRLPTITERRLKRRDDRAFPSSNVFEKWGQIGLSPPSSLITATDMRIAKTFWPSSRRWPSPMRGQRAALLLRPRTLDSSISSGRGATTSSAGRTPLDGESVSWRSQLPERAQTVHVIRTDDPTGIEGYWHRRFADRRGNGEWFALTPTDVAAFRRRKFM